MSKQNLHSKIKREDKNKGYYLLQKATISEQHNHLTLPLFSMPREAGGAGGGGTGGCPCPLGGGGPSLIPPG